MKPIFREQVEVIASDLNSTTWSELYDTYKAARALDEDPNIINELAYLIGEVQRIHDRVLNLAKFFPNEEH
jgi:hypothetical protein